MMGVSGFCDGCFTFQADSLTTRTSRPSDDKERWRGEEGGGEGYTMTVTRTSRPSDAKEGWRGGGKGAVRAIL